MNKHYLALTCEALARSIYQASANSDHTVSIQLLKQGLHNTPKKLRAALQAEIDAVEADQYDAILLVYGICGTSTIGISARYTPLVMPRAHDCITLYLGSHQRYQEEFDRHPGTYWYSVDYLERNADGDSMALGASGIAETEAQHDEYVVKYGKKNADMLIETMRQWSSHYSRAVFINTGLGDSEPYENMAREKARKEDWVFERLEGNRRLLEMLIYGQWSEDEFLIVPPGNTIRQSYHDGLIKAEPTEMQD